MIIDSHAHFVPPALLEEIADTAADFPALELVPYDSGFGFSFAGAAATRPVSPLLSDVGERLDWMDQHQIDHQVVGGWLDMFGYEMPAEDGEEPVVRMFWRERVRREADLDQHLTQKTLHVEDPVYSIRYLLPSETDKRRTAEIDVSSDYEVQFARDLILAAPSYHRSEMLASATKVVSHQICQAMLKGLGY